MGESKQQNGHGIFGVGGVTFIMVGILCVLDVYRYVTNYSQTDLSKAATIFNPLCESGIRSLPRKNSLL